jgi:hypothetical protein
MKIFKKIMERLRLYSMLPSRLDAIQESLGRIESRLHSAVGMENPCDHEFKVYSQWGEDGIIDYLVTHVEMPTKMFIEFGVENYTEANTLFLLKHRNWGGLVIDGSATNVAAIKARDIFWKYDLHAVCFFITKDNINQIIQESGFAGDVGLLSVDIDGNDYFVWDAINVVSPRVVIAEYNSLYGATAKVSIPYQPDFYRRSSGKPVMYYGASLAALNYLAEKKGYALVAGNSAGNNVFFVRRDCLGSLRALTPEQVYVRESFRESRAQDGSVNLMTFEERQLAISHLPLYEVTTSAQVYLKDLL